MKHFLSLLRHELRTLFRSGATYVAAVLFLLVMGFFFLMVMWSFSQEPIDSLPTADFLKLFWVPVCFMVPLLTMKSLAEERRTGTLETLMTTPVTATEIVLSKFIAAYVFYCILWLLTLSYPYIVSLAFSNPAISEPLLDRATLRGGYLFITVSGLLFVATGIFASSLTRSQLVAGMLAFCILLMLILLPFVILNQQFAIREWLESPLSYMHIFNQLDDFCNGVIDTRPLVFYFSNTILVLGLSVLIVEAKA